MALTERATQFGRAREQLAATEARVQVKSIHDILMLYSAVYITSVDPSSAGMY